MTHLVASATAMARSLVRDPRLSGFSFNELVSQTWIEAAKDERKRGQVTRFLRQRVVEVLLRQAGWTCRRRDGRRMWERPTKVRSSDVLELCQQASGMRAKRRRAS